MFPRLPDPAYMWELHYADTGDLYLHFDVSAGEERRGEGASIVVFREDKLFLVPFEYIWIDACVATRRDGFIIALRVQKFGSL